MLSAQREAPDQENCFVARPVTDLERVAKYAVLVQARRNFLLELQDGQDDPMRQLTHNEVSAILTKLKKTFLAREDQKQKRAMDQTRWDDRSSNREPPMQRPTLRAHRRFTAMIHQLFKLKVAVDDVVLEPYGGGNSGQ